MLWWHWWIIGGLIVDALLLAGTKPGDFDRFSFAAVILSLIAMIVIWPIFVVSVFIGAIMEGHKNGWK